MTRHPDDRGNRADLLCRLARSGDRLLARTGVSHFSGWRRFHSGSRKTKQNKRREDNRSPPEQLMKAVDYRRIHNRAEARVQGQGFQR
jgi:hypothetical protein